MGTTELTDSLFDDNQREKPDPYALFSAWLSEADETEPHDHIAMSLATVDKDGLPNCRIVLCNRYDERGFVFFTNRNSAKGQEMAYNPKAALLFHWKSNRRQIRIRGPVEVVTPQESDDYFATRPRGSQVGAHASSQSEPLNSRQDLIDRISKLETQFEGGDVPRPEHWIGYRVVPQEIEFWENGEFRLHNRVTFTRQIDSNDWSAERLNP